MFVGRDEGAVGHAGVWYRNPRRATRHCESLDILREGDVHAALHRFRPQHFSPQACVLLRPEIIFSFMARRSSW
jgi:hypothetical protein